jgi:hypothetical protein
MVVVVWSDDVLYSGLKEIDRDRVVSGVESLVANHVVRMSKDLIQFASRLCATEWRRMRVIDRSPKVHNSSFRPSAIDRHLGYGDQPALVP